MSTLKRIVVSLMVVTSFAQTKVAAQCMTMSPDTSICGSSPVTIRANFNGGLGTGSYSVSPIPYAPPVPWSSGTFAAGLGTDDIYSTAATPLGFTFCFYGNTYTQCLLSANNYLTFNTSGTVGGLTYGPGLFSPWTIPGPIPRAASTPRNCIMGPWLDVDPSVAGSGRIKYLTSGTAPCRMFIVIYDNIRMFSCTSLSYRGMMVLYESTNVIETYIENKPACSGWNSGRAIHGLHDATATLATVVPGRNSTDWTAVNDGVRFTPTGPPNYTVTWTATPGGPIAASPTATSITVTPPAGVTTTYTATVTFTCNGGVMSGSTRVTASTGFTISDTTLNRLRCYGDSNASIRVTPSGGALPYRYRWSTSSRDTLPTLSGLRAGIYTCLITDALGCAMSRSIIVTQPPQVVANANYVLQRCFNEASSSAMVSTTGGTGRYTYSWSTTPARTSDSISGLMPGIYTCTITDSLGCSDTARVNIPVRPRIGPTILASSNVKCFGGSDGTVTIGRTAGTPGFSYAVDGSAFGASNLITGLRQGAHMAYVRDTLGCTDSIAFNLTQPTILAIRLDSMIPTPCGLSTGVLQISVSGGTTPYRYAWSNGDITSRADSLFGSSRFSVTVTDSNLCTTSDSFIVGLLQPRIIRDSIANSRCAGSRTGYIGIHVSSGSPPLRFTWSHGDTLANAANLGPGHYSVTVRDALGCSATDSFDITEPTALQVRLDSIRNASCNGTADGAIYLTASGGVLPYNYSWSNSEITPNNIGIPLGTYILTLTDSHLCVRRDTFRITEPATVVNTLVSRRNVSCRGGNNGLLQISVAGGTLPYRYAWSNGDTTTTLNSLIAGTYVVTVTDVNRCSDIDTFVVTQPPLLTTTTSGNSLACFNDRDGSVTVIANGGTLPYRYLWDDPAAQTTATASGLNGGLYRVTVTDSLGCVKTDSIRITEPTRLVATLVSQTNVNCFGERNGAFTINVSGGTPSYDYSTDGGATWTTSGVYSSMAAGAYNVTVRDDSGCLVNQPVTLTQPSQLTLNLTSLQNVNCFAENNGRIQISVGGGILPYVYSWTNGDISNIADSLIAGTYRIIVTDSHNCVIRDSFTVTQPPLLTSRTSGISLRCFNDRNGSVTVTPAGGTTPYRYLWDDPAAQTTATATGLNGGTYHVTVTDAHGCIKTDLVTITEPTLLVATLTSQTNINCFGERNGAFTINVSGGTPSYDYSIDAGVTWTTSGLYSAMGAGGYTVRVRDDSGCIVNQNVTLSQPSQLNIALTSLQNVNCFGENNGRIQTSVSGGVPPYVYSWTNGDNTNVADSLVAGIYILVVTDSHNCVIRDTFTITQPALLTVRLAGVNILCNAGTTGSITATPAGGTTPYRYLWNDAAAQTTATATGLVAGSYRVTVTDAHGCTVTDSMTLTEPPALTLTETHINVTCNNGRDGSIIAAGGGGAGTLNYSKDGVTFSPSGRFTGLAAGIYTITLRDGNGCTKTQSVTITQPLRIAPVILTVTNASCNGFADGSVTVGQTNGRAPFQYSLDRISYQSSNLFSRLRAGLYKLIVQDSLGCQDSTTFTVTEPAPVGLIITPTQPKCFNDSTGIINVSGSGGTTPYQFSFDNGLTFSPSSVLNNLPANTYFIVIRDANGCTTSGSVTLSYPPLFTLSPLAEDVRCWDSEDGSINCRPAGGTLPYQWFTATLGGARIDSSRVALIRNLGPGTWTLNGFDANGCLAVGVATINSPPIDTFSFAVDSTTCFGPTVHDGAIHMYAGANPPYSYSVDGGPFQLTNHLYQLTAGLHLVVAQNRNGCLDSMTIVVPNPPPIVLDLVPDTVYLNLGGTEQVIVIQRNAISPTYLWNSLEGLSCTDCPNPYVTAYNDLQLTVRVYDNRYRFQNFDCFEEATLYVIVDPHKKSWVPNAFTPNGDGYNDIFLIFGEGIKKLRMEVFDRWGEKMFESDNQRVGWDGYYKGTAMNPGVYVYHVDVEYLDGEVESYQGSITLIR